MNDEMNDGWGDDVQESLEDVFGKLEKLMYEVKNCVRGGYTRCNTQPELADYIRSLASGLEAAADTIG